MVSLSLRREIISEKSLRNVIEVVAYLKLSILFPDPHNRQMFREAGYRRRVRQISGYIATGSQGLETILLERTPVEIAAGLQYYLVRLPKPLIPPYIQMLGLDANNNVLPEIVAGDILGLINQDVKGRRFILIGVILDLLNFMRKHATSDEIVGSNIPITMLPVFFQLQMQHLSKWRVIASIFLEIIDLAPLHLPIGLSQTNSYMQTNHLLQEQRNEMNFTEQLRQLLLQETERTVVRLSTSLNDSSGDAHFPEVISLNQIHPALPPNLLNNVFGYYKRR